MKRLYLLRHAKSSWSEPGLDDQMRPLNKRGLHDAPMMGERFQQRGEHLERVLSSPALRARTTAELFTGSCASSAGAIVIEPDLYFLGSGSIEEVIRGQAAELQSLLLVFHNPDITHFANSIAYEFHVDNVPTCGLISLQCTIGQWSDWSRDTTSFDYYDYPRNESGAVLRA